MTRPRLLVPIALAASLALCAVATAEPARPGAMTVTGSATLEVSPDCFDVTMAINAEAATPGKAMRAVQARQAAVIAQLARIGVSGADVRLSQVSLAPLYDPPREGVVPRVRGYRGDVTVTATSRDLDKLGEVMDIGATAGVAQMWSGFRRSNLPELKARVRDLALTAARDKAKQLVDGTGAKLGRVVSIAEGGNTPIWYAGAQVSNAVEVQPNAVAVGAVAGPLQALTLEVTVSYELAL